MFSSLLNLSLSHVCVFLFFFLLPYLQLANLMGLPALEFFTSREGKLARTGDGQRGTGGLFLGSFAQSFIYSVVHSFIHSFSCSYVSGFGLNSGYATKSQRDTVCKLMEFTICAYRDLLTISTNKKQNGHKFFPSRRSSPSVETYKSKGKEVGKVRHREGHLTQKGRVRDPLGPQHQWTARQMASVSEGEEVHQTEVWACV